MFFFRIFALLGVQFLTKSFIPDIKHLNIYSEFWGFFFPFEMQNGATGDVCMAGGNNIYTTSNPAWQKTTSLQTYKYIYFGSRSMSEN